MADSESILANMSQLTEDFWIDSSVKVFDNPSPIEFLRNSYSSYTPSILTGMMDDWAAYGNWDMNYLLEKLGDKEVRVNFTPDGRADSVIQHSSNDTTNNDSMKKDHTANGKVFVYPLQATIPFSVFHKMLTDPQPTDAVPYLSEQNDNFRQEFSAELSQDIPSQFALADACFGKNNNKKHEVSSTVSPEAVNLWIGDERSVSSLHKDHFENFYAVLHGTKTFTLFPPTDTAFLPENTYKTAIYKLKKHSFSTSSTPSSSSSLKVHGVEVNRIRKSDMYLSSDITGECNELPSELSWIPIDPDPTPLTTNDAAIATIASAIDGVNLIIDQEDKDDRFVTHQLQSVNEYPQYKYAHPIRCQVHAGEILYIPAMWYHRVSQTCLTIAVNYWYDQRFDFRYVFYQTIRKICETASDASSNDQNAAAASDSAVVVDGTPSKHVTDSASAGT